MKKHSLEFEKPLLDLEKQLEEIVKSSHDSDLDFSTEIKAIEKKIEQTKRDVYSDLTPWQKVQLSRHPNRPYSIDYIEQQIFLQQTCLRNKMYDYRLAQYVWRKTKHVVQNAFYKNPYPIRHYPYPPEQHAQETN